MSKTQRGSTRPADVWDGEACVRSLNSAALVRSSRADELRFHLMELIECCATFRGRVDVLTQAFVDCREDSQALWDASCNLLGEFEHSRYHIRGAKSVLNQISDASRNMPPLKDLNDEQLTALILKPHTKRWAHFGKKRRKKEKE